jgi:hypothetical protein
MSAKHPAVPVSLIHTGSCFFIGEVAVLGGPCLGDLPYSVR